jgi:hypothetical protein
MQIDDASEIKFDAANWTERGRSIRDIVFDADTDTGEPGKLGNRGRREPALAENSVTNLP